MGVRLNLVGFVLGKFMSQQLVGGFFQYSSGMSQPESPALETWTWVCHVLRVPFFRGFKGMSTQQRRELSSDP